MLSERFAIVHLLHTYYFFFILKAILGEEDVIVVRWTQVLMQTEVKGDEIPIHAKKEVIEALQDLEDEYDLHPKHAVKKKSFIINPNRHRLH